MTGSCQWNSLRAAVRTPIARRRRARSRPPPRGRMRRTARAGGRAPRRAAAARSSTRGSKTARRRRAAGGRARARARRVGIEPVERLPDEDGVNARVLQGNLFSGALEHLAMRDEGAHRLVRLHRDDTREPLRELVGQACRFRLQGRAPARTRRARAPAARDRATPASTRAARGRRARQRARSSGQAPSQRQSASRGSRSRHHDATLPRAWSDHEARPVWTAARWLNGAVLRSCVTRLTRRCDLGLTKGAGRGEHGRRDTRQPTPASRNARFSFSISRAITRRWIWFVPS